MGAPGLVERSSGYGFSIKSPQELVTTFGAHPLPFYAYNVVASVLAVMLSERANGVFVFVRNVLTGRPTAAMYLNVISSTLTTLAIVWYVVQRGREWIKGELKYYDRLFFVAVAMIGAKPPSALMPRTSLWSSDGLFRYCHVHWHCTPWSVNWRDVASARASVAMCVVLAIIVVGWSIRSLSFYADMRIQSYKAQTDWVFLDDWIRSGQLEIKTSADRDLAERFQAEMIGMAVPKVYLDPPWIKELLTTE